MPEPNITLEFLGFILNEFFSNLILCFFYYFCVAKDNSQKLLEKLTFVGKFPENIVNTRIESNFLWLDIVHHCKQ